MYFQVEILNIWYIYAKLITSGVVLAWNFLGNKYWTFLITHRAVDVPEQFAFQLSIVIPAFNEENRIKTTLLSIYDFLEEKNIDAEVIVVDDGSTDKTLDIIQSKKTKFKNLSLISLDKNQGKGFAVKTGVERAQGELILVTDADNSTPIEEFAKMLSAMDQGYDIVIGSRYLKDSSIKIKQPFSRIMIGRIGNFLIRLFVVNNIKDTQCGFKLFKHDVAKEIFSRQKIKRWGFDMEVLAIAQLLNFKTKEVPVSWFNSTDTRLRPVRDALGTFWELIYVKLNLMSGRYED